MNADKPFTNVNYDQSGSDLKAQVRWTLLRFINSPAYHMEFQVAQQRIYAVLWLIIFTALSAIVGLVIFRFDAQWVWLAWSAYLIGAFCILWKPVSGLYLILFLSLVGDNVLMPAFPFNKNFSSAESLFFIHNSLIVSALEVYLALTVLGWLLRGIARKNLNFHWGPVGKIVLFFLVWIVVGLVYGLSRGGNLTIALWEVRPLFYLPIMYFLAVNLLEDTKQINLLIWMAMIAIFIQSLTGIWAFFTVHHGTLVDTESIMEHSASIHTNTMLVLILAAWLYRGSWAKRVLLLLMALPVLFAYLANQRRASYVALGIALLLFLVALYRENRRAFKIIAPLAIMAVGIYLVLFWNNNSLVGMPARGVRTALIASAGTRDYSSNLYRLIENVNTTYTIRHNLLLGVGFGNKFMILVRMPDISIFEWWEYITHNSILWLWIKTGIPGFIALLMMIGATITMGVDIYDRLPDADSKAIGLTMVLYVVMHFIYAYVDMSWDVQSMVYIGTAMGVLAALGRLMPGPGRERKRMLAGVAEQTG